MSKWYLHRHRSDFGVYAPADPCATCGFAKKNKRHKRAGRADVHRFISELEIEDDD